MDPWLPGDAMFDTERAYALYWSARRRAVAAGNAEGPGDFGNEPEEELLPAAVRNACRREI